MAPTNRPNCRTATVWSISVSLKMVHQLDAFVRCFHTLTLFLSYDTIDYMEPILITEKGVEWLVHPDARIFRPAITTTTKRRRNDKEQFFTSLREPTKINPWVSKSGYFVVSAKLGNIRPKVFVHRLVAMAFVPGFAQGLTVNHINGNKLDNRPENLEWVTLSENTKHQWRTGLVDLRGENQPNHKLTQRQVIHIRKALRAGVSANSLSIIAGVNASTIYLIEQGKRWKHLLD
jgi:hypothetical protein